MKKNVTRLRKKLRKHPNSIMLMSYIIAISTASFFPTLATTMPYIFILIIPILILILNLWIRKTLKEIWHDFRSTNWLKIILMVFITAGVVAFLTFVAAEGKVESNNSKQIVMMLSKYWYMTPYVLIVAPILEELTFRSSLYAVVVRVIGSVVQNETTIKIATYICVGIGFAMVHADNMMAIYIIFSSFLQWITAKWGLKYAIGTHIGMNAMSFLIMFI
ncbi:CPBP family intramembrane metalloprotease [Pediococcus pentosaceus]|uniref:CPBP family intramembrane glutamic endopeptidase n=1 Tax=Pediococcus pentosaceus TaxID=1255 RepID=UPI001C1EEA1E|nr:CPBP family intramembrane glutamic endopeptidase [Pediococcus pentosaceus]MBU7002067.1 CPBP family intramembrane metalloprotease [Pediococcus pentosaceus]MCG9227440.1 CPBP family intramembrane metalloprotease [Pediococcus pentosaceus]MDA8037483.1 CPBP family intramembrane metalloprotease [Pediococcus pentosaceus]